MSRAAVAQHGAVNGLSQLLIILQLILYYLDAKQSRIIAGEIHKSITDWVVERLLMFLISFLGFDIYVETFCLLYHNLMCFKCVSGQGLVVGACIWSSIHSFF